MTSPDGGQRLTDPDSPDDAANEAAIEAVEEHTGADDLPEQSAQDADVEVAYGDAESSDDYTAADDVSTPARPPSPGGRAGRRRRRAGGVPGGAGGRGHRGGRGRRGRCRRAGPGRRPGRGDARRAAPRAGRLVRRALLRRLREQGEVQPRDPGADPGRRGLHLPGRGAHRRGHRDQERPAQAGAAQGAARLHPGPDGAQRPVVGRRAQHAGRHRLRRRDLASRRR